MSKTLRLSEKWFRRGLWLVAFLFAWFLIGLGSVVVGDLPQVEQAQSLEDFLDPERTPVLKAEAEAAEQAQAAAEDALDQARLRLQTARADNSAAREAFDNWLATRSATQRSDQNAEVIRRTRDLDALLQTERQALAAIQQERQVALDAQQAQARANTELAAMRDQARGAYGEAQRAQELRVFGYRLAITLPLLVLAAYLFKQHRNGASWPFVWGFIFFALFAFFVELVPYLPSYGGYVRYLVGILLTVIGGRYAIQALQRYLERQKQVESLPDTQRRQGLDHDTAQARLGKNACPACERPVDLKDNKTDFCPHCGMCLFDRCGPCGARKSAFARYCFACGAPAKAPALSESAPPQPTQAAPGTSGAAP